MVVGPSGFTCAHNSNTKTRFKQLHATFIEELNQKEGDKHNNRNDKELDVRGSQLEARAPSYTFGPTGPRGSTQLSSLAWETGELTGFPLPLDPGTIRAHYLVPQTGQ
ncbi:hypothetical protein OUZ56_005429 [Daphnia magna]|uniref:Uncharacterized protein n=1 Tax=Daphnia magna TaxID=35525 RepID=A0ABQ9YST1_9CRUS|nr:hypothetical protein OUZ56_005429 [Daphnia magna]